MHSFGDNVPLNDHDLALFLTYAGGMLERADVLAQALSKTDLSRHIDEFEKLKRGRGDDDGAIPAQGPGPRPKPLLGSTEKPNDGDI